MSSFPQLLVTICVCLFAYHLYCYLQTPYHVFGFNGYVASLKFKWRYHLSSPEHVYNYIGKLRDSTMQSVDSNSTPDKVYRHDFSVSYASGRQDDESHDALFLSNDHTLHQMKSIAMRLYVPKDTDDQLINNSMESQHKSRPIWIYLHGGGWHLNSVDVFDKNMRYFSTKFNVAVLGVNYRKFPSHSYFQLVNDCLYTVLYASKKLATDFPQYKLDTNDLTLVGDSAGGNLASAVSHRLRDLHLANQVPDLQVKRQILLYPAVYYYPHDKNKFDTYREFGQHGLLMDEGMLTKMWSQYANTTLDSIVNDENLKYLAVLGPNKHNTRFDQLPETVIIAAEYDILRGEAEEYSKKLKQANVKVHYDVVPNTLHGFIFHIPGSLRVGEIIAKHLNY